MKPANAYLVNNVRHLKDFFFGSETPLVPRKKRGFKIESPNWKFAREAILRHLDFFVMEMTPCGSSMCSRSPA